MRWRRRRRRWSRLRQENRKGEKNEKLKNSSYQPKQQQQQQLRERESSYLKYTADGTLRGCEMQFPKKERKGENGKLGEDTKHKNLYCKVKKKPLRVET